MRGQSASGTLARLLYAYEQGRLKPEDRKPWDQLEDWHREAWQQEAQGVLEEAGISAGYDPVEALHDLAMEGRIIGLSHDGIASHEDPTGSLARAAAVLAEAER